jgi:hypothetical protein
VSSLSTNFMVRALRTNDSSFILNYNSKNPSISIESLKEIKQIIDQKIPEFMQLKEVILRNRSIDPRFQYELYQYLLQNIEHIFPPFPGDPSFYAELIRDFQIYF